MLRSLPVSHGSVGIFLFIAVVFPFCCLLVYRYLTNMSSCYLHSLTYHNPGNIGENPYFPPDCHLSCLLPALTIHVYI
ncbi:hypothetical protein DWX56_12595 [Parabacteroides merdae]|uniref:Uncharacterized protein n=2 Tax=Bacteroides TaxID=816 RepID=A0A413B5Z1_BACSE|nr:hypothetical protein F3B28_15545 [Bacteroides fragilis]RGS99604.1 hypothetical protein DWX56_12595 [Parabacteroides merdae]RGW33548.1 hypothetical protein DWV77_10425 [Bacteroides stercoris]RJU21800.1 hypothetical protein DW012_06230 [Bacteroides sp. AF37-16AC]KAA4704788.1 hypothetical protein F3B27_22395 [Bacteroides fragilis]